MQFNIPTLLTLFRVVLIPFFVLAFYLPVVWAPFACALIFLIARSPTGLMAIWRAAGIKAPVSVPSSIRWQIK
jgi:hypothetical protein